MKKKLKSIATISILALFVACSSTNDAVDDTIADEVTPETPDTINDISMLLSKFDGTGLSYAVNDGTVTFTTEDLPNHTSPYWPTSNDLYEEYNGTNMAFHQNPNEIATQNITLTITLNPEEAAIHEATSLGTIGIARNGIVLYNQYAGPDQPLTNEIDSFDQWLGHPQGQSTYHYHIEPTFLTQEFGEDAFIGLLADGFPVYGPLEDGEIIISADLDEFHGHIGVTADFPDGIYHYHVTADDPYINGNGFFGTPGNITN
jgi:hypothetical protein